MARPTPVHHDIKGLPPEPHQLLWHQAPEVSSVLAALRTKEDPGSLFAENKDGLEVLGKHASLCFSVFATTFASCVFQMGIGVRCTFSLFVTVFLVLFTYLGPACLHACLSFCLSAPPPPPPVSLSLCLSVTVCLSVFLFFFFFFKQLQAALILA